MNTLIDCAPINVGPDIRKGNIVSCWYYKGKTYTHVATDTTKWLRGIALQDSSSENRTFVLIQGSYEMPVTLERS